MGCWTQLVVDMDSKQDPNRVSTALGSGRSTLIVTHSDRPHHPKIQVIRFTRSSRIQDTNKQAREVKVGESSIHYRGSKPADITGVSLAPSSNNFNDQ
jgi:hypothetical protein